MKKSNIQRSMSKDIVYGSLLELSKNKLVWYESSIDPSYSHLTDEGKEAIIPIVESILREIRSIEQQLINETAKQQTMDALKGKE